MKYSNDTIGNQTRDLPACSAVPQIVKVVVIIVIVLIVVVVIVIVLIVVVVRTTEAYIKSSDFGLSFRQFVTLGKWPELLDGGKPI